VTPSNCVKGRLIALEGSGGRSMAVAIRQLQRTLRKTSSTTAGVSGWDASAIFFQMREGARGVPGPPARALILLYAADLAFRLRWQIRPALEEGVDVIAAPYLETAYAFGLAAGLSRRWLNAVFVFAPQADGCYRVPESGIPVSRRGTPADSFLEISFAQLRNSPGVWRTDEIRQGFDCYLDRLEARGKVRPVTRTLRDFAAEAG